MFKGEAAERNFSGELNLAKKVAGNQALGRRGENCCRQMGNRGKAGSICKQKRGTFICFSGREMCLEVDLGRSCASC